MSNKSQTIPINKRVIYAGDVFNSLMAEKKWSATEAADFVKKFQMVDAVEVVRCKNCKKWDPKTETCDEFTLQRLPFGGRAAFLTRETDFCSYGERRTDE